MEIMTNQRFKKAGKYLRAMIILSLIGMAIATIIIAGILIYAKILGPPPLAVPQSTLFYSDDGTVIGESHNGQKRYWIELSEISPHLVNATISIEDRKFYSHHGFDYTRIAGAIIADIKAMAKVQGASTISQQYARNLFLEHEKTWNRKLKEAFFTIRLEMNYTKKEILEGYLNTIYYGHGAYGSEAASQFYFGKHANELTLGEASILAGIPKGAGIYSPLVSIENAKSRQKVILNTMIENGYIDKQSATAALHEPLTIVGKHLHTKSKIAPYFQDAVRQALKTQLHLDDRIIELGGLKVYTTLDLKQQEIAEQTVNELISRESEIQTGLVSMDPKNGHVKAMVGGRDYEESPFNRAVQAVRQPGSTMKPLLYYAALESGFTPSTMMRSEQTTFRFDDGRPDYTPKNFNSQYADGDITMAQALALSDNIYAVKTHLFLGLDTLVNTAKKFGISTKMSMVPSLALGTSGVRVIEMANAYSIFANGGKKVSPVLITRVENPKGDIIYEQTKEAIPVLRPELAYVMTQMMTGIFDPKLNGYTSVTGRSIIKDMTRTYAGKSGSTDTDSWMIGYSPQLVTAVWTGYDKGKTITLSADKSYAKNIWIHFMEKAHEGLPVKGFKPVKGTVGVYVNPENGKLATDQCPVKRLTYFVEGTEPTEYCTDHLMYKEEVPNKKEKPAKKPWYKKLFDW
ncbi:transglycosylase domain-containing protein [Bacillus sp. S/N-304-OC-R1]|uniref:transglycosylase domain-containing protein n=1 Tax=Bacillus sp. S/N-304-OC-R1 TaxID=2758034 RepID=UPI001C8E411F|nr:PBP1A family penicillin-binding protein [Bacillus sp. S/N-304-OC-R1]MBY0123289.1 PBP1A family penicillin-binding protein [Bacillus sp. S/N-304-OC-R1]